MVTIGINGLGRIGRGVLRALEEQAIRTLKWQRSMTLRPLATLRIC